MVLVRELLLDILKGGDLLTVDRWEERVEGKGKRKWVVREERKVWKSCIRGSVG